MTSPGPDTSRFAVPLASPASVGNRGGVNLHDWIDELCDVLDVEVDLDEALVLDVAREAAHNVERPAAPITTFLLGYAAAGFDGDPEQVEVIQRCAELTAEAMPRLQSMKNLEEYWIEVNRLENAGDKNYRRTLANLFSGQYEALEVLKLKDIVESLEGAIDAFEKVANTVEQIAVKES